MKISIQLEMPQPDVSPVAPKPSIEDQIHKTIELVESGYCSQVEFLMLRKLQASLKKKKSTPRIQNLLEMIQPVLNKYGYHDDVSEGHQKP